MNFSVLELCAGGGGQALGLEQAGFEAAGVVEIDPHCCSTLRMNRPDWNVIESDVKEVSGRNFQNVDLVAGGVPCPPFSVAGKQLGREDERDLFPEALRIIKESAPRAALLENVQGFASSKFSDYRLWLKRQFAEMGYTTFMSVLNASNFGVCQLRPRFVCVALKSESADSFIWPDEMPCRETVGDALIDLMSANNWPGSLSWKAKANAIAPTIVGGSKKHGGPDLGPTRAKRQWEKLSVDGKGIADEAPGNSVPAETNPRLTNRMVARLQGFPDEWMFHGKKTAAYRQIGNAFPPPVSEAVGRAIAEALSGAKRRGYRKETSGQLSFMEAKPSAQ